MLVLVLNCGSSSVKYALYDWPQLVTLTKGNIERLGQKDGPANHKIAIKELLEGLTDAETGVIENINEIKAVGHRVVHGGDKFNRSVRVTPDILTAIRSVTSLAPLHLPANIMGIESAMAALPGTAQVAIFDTAFHQTLPPVAYLYPVPYNWYEDYGVRKYGFHGSSHLYVSKRAARWLKKPSNEVNLITLHIGNGVSFTAIRNGISVDTSMGMTPLGGAMMGTRSGDIDPAIFAYMADRLDLGAIDVVDILNTRSGHLGITGQFSDRRDVEAAAKTGDARCTLSLEMEIYRIKKYIGSYLAAAGPVDALVFTAGVGENDAVIRAGVLKNMAHLGIKLDENINAQTRSSSGETELSAPDSVVKVLMIPTNEEAVMVEDVVAILEGTYDVHTRYVYRFEK